MERIREPQSNTISNKLEKESLQTIQKLKEYYIIRSQSNFSLLRSNSQKIRIENDKTKRTLSTAHSIQQIYQSNQYNLKSSSN